MQDLERMTATRALRSRAERDSLPVLRWPRAREDGCDVRAVIVIDRMEPPILPATERRECAGPGGT